MTEVNTNLIHHYMKKRACASKNNNIECYELCDKIIYNLSYRKEYKLLEEELRKKFPEYCI